MEKKEIAKKKTVKPELKKEIILQFYGKEYTEKEIVAKVKEVWTKDMKRKVSEMKSLKIYLKPEESAAYFVVNEEADGKVEL